MKLEHLKMIQVVIARLANNSFTIKAWSITLFMGTVALFFSNGLNFNKLETELILIIIIATFYFMDCFYLTNERKYRELYNTVLNVEDSKITYDMTIRKEFKISDLKVLYSGSMLVYLPEALLAIIMLFL